MNAIGFKIKQHIKSYIQNSYLPKIYQKEAAKREVDRERVIFAEMHSDTLPYSMQSVYDSLKASGKDVVLYCRDIKKMSYRDSLRFMKDFMKDYAAAGYVYICSYFLPVSSCKKRKETKVIQLWHSGGLLKKMGYDTKDDIPKGYKGNVTANYDLVTVSAPVCEKYWRRALHIPAGVTKALGLPRTDIYFNEDWQKKCREDFESLYPVAKGKKVILYAPSFSGNAASPISAGLNMRIDEAFKNEQDYFLIIRPHPLMKYKFPEYFDEISEKISTESLLPVADILITDYSSILFDYSIFKKPFVLFCPDLEQYKNDRGFYANPETFPCSLVKTSDELLRVITSGEYLEKADSETLNRFYEKYMGSCDGNATMRVINEVN